MVSKNIGPSVRMVLLFFITVYSVTFSLDTFSQNISKKYVSYMQDSGILYYILPQKGFQNTNTNGSFVYDITYLTSKDSATINFTYTDITAYIIDSIAIEKNEKIYVSQAKKIFIDTKKNKWRNRFSATFSLSQLSEIFNDEEYIPAIILHTNLQNLELKIDKSKWKKQSFAISEILKIIKYN